VGILSSRRNLNPLSWNIEIKNIHLDVDLMRMIILKLGPKCFNGIYWNLFLVLGEMKSHKIQKDISCS
jgi:hypothetical protein